MPPSHTLGECVLLHGMHVQLALHRENPNYERVGLHHDMGMTVDVRDHAHVGYLMAQNLGFEAWECDLIRYHMGLFNIANDPNPSERMISRFRREHAHHLEGLAILARADVVDYPDQLPSLERAILLVGG